MINKETHMEDMKYSSNSQTTEFLSPTKNKIKHYSHNSDVEMVTLQPITYTSLKDLLPLASASSTAAASSMPMLLSPSVLYGSQSTSWHDIPIKNPLVKHAAWAYLQPMLSPLPSANQSSFFVQLKDKCECIRFLKAVVLPAIKEALWRLFGEGKEEEEEEDDDVD